MTQEPKRRPQLRSKLGKTYYGALRRLWWLKMSRHFAQERRSARLPHVHFTHATPLSRKLQGEKLELQRNKVTLVVERHHHGYDVFPDSRRNRRIRQVYSLTGELLHEELAAENCAIMMYSPMLLEKS